MSTEIQAIRRDLDRLQKTPLSIIKLSEPFTLPAAPPPPSSSTTTTTTSTTQPLTADRDHDDDDEDDHDANDPQHPSPASLASDLTHYRSLFKKLHFSYLEQVSKEKFLRAIIVGNGGEEEGPVVVEPAENAALEKELAGAKARLQAQKADVDALVAELEAQARALARRYEAGVAAVRTNAGLLYDQDLPARIEETRGRIEELERAANQQTAGGQDGHDHDEGGGAKKMPLSRTREVLLEKRAELAEVEREIAELTREQPERKRALESLEAELRPLEARRSSAVNAAEEARRRKEMREAGLSDELELKGRWYKGANELLADMLGRRVEGAAAAAVEAKS